MLCVASVMGSESLHPWLGCGARGRVWGLEKALQDSRERRQSGQDAAQLCWRQVPQCTLWGFCSLLSLSPVPWTRDRCSGLECLWKLLQTPSALSTRAFTETPGVIVSVNPNLVIGEHIKHPVQLSSGIFHLSSMYYFLCKIHLELDLAWMEL